MTKQSEMQKRAELIKEVNKLIDAQINKMLEEAGWTLPLDVTKEVPK